MASRRVSSIHKSHKSGLGDSNTSKDTSENNSSNGAKKKKPVRIVKSRYLQAADMKKPAKNTALNESTFSAPRPASPKGGSVPKTSMSTPPRRSLASQSILNPMSMTSSILEPLQLGGNILQSTILDGHCIRPEFDVSSIKEKTVVQNTVEPENEKKILEIQTFLLAYLAAKIESNTQKLRAEAEASILAVMEEEEQMRKRVHEKKRRHLLLEKQNHLNHVMDMQITALTPVCAVAKQFTWEYRSFATAVDTTRHELPVKSFHLAGDRREFLDKAETCLKESERVLARCTGGSPGSEVASDILSGMRSAAGDLEEQISRVFSEVLELSSLVSRQAVQARQSLEEKTMGRTRAHELYFPKP